jgi:hypothetical protein
MAHSKRGTSSFRISIIPPICKAQGLRSSRITPQGQTSLFFTSTQGKTGLSAALGILADGIVVTGYLPSTDGTSQTAQPGGLPFIDRRGTLLGTLTDPKLFDGPDLGHLHGPLDLALTPDGHLLVANSDGRNADPNQPSELVEFNVGGEFLSQFSLDPDNGGAFGLATHFLGHGALRVAAVDDNQNLLNMWTTVVR